MAYQTLPSLAPYTNIPTGDNLVLFGGTNQDLGSIANFGNVSGSDLASLAANYKGSVKPGLFSSATDWMNQNGQTLNTILSGAGSLFGAWNGMRNYGLAKDSFGLQKKAFETNLRNSTKTYNTALEDRIRGRSSEQSEADVQAYLAKNRL